jgi:2-hydroxy-3-oxopropionate reductase
MAMEVGFVGIGVMGVHMARNLLRAGYRVRVYDVRAGAADALRGEGAVMTESPRACAGGAELVITMLPNSPHVEEAVFGPAGVSEGLREGAIIVDMSTISPTVTQRLAERLLGLGIALLDAPVSGGQKGAKEGTLSIMVGGSEEAFQRALPVLQAMGKTITHLGSSGMGQTAKLCNQLVCAINIQGVCEAFALGRAAGLDLEQLRTVLLGGAASSWMLDVLGPQMLAGDVSAGFRIDLHLKDLALVGEAAFEWGVPLPAATLASQMYLEARAHGEGDNGNQAMFKVYDRLTGQQSGSAPSSDEG